MSTHTQDGMVFAAVPEEIKTILEVWLVEIKGEGIVRQVSLAFSESEAKERRDKLNEIVPGVATAWGPYQLVD